MIVLSFCLIVWYKSMPICSSTLTSEQFVNLGWIYPMMSINSIYLNLLKNLGRTELFIKMCFHNLVTIYSSFQKNSLEKIVQFSSKKICNISGWVYVSFHVLKILFGEDLFSFIFSSYLILHVMDYNKKL